MNSYPPHTHCIICGKATMDGAAFCSREHALEQQRRVLGHTLAALRQDRSLKVTDDIRHTNIVPFRQRCAELLRGWKRE